MQTVQSLEWSRDGRRVVFTAPTETGTALWTQEVGSAAPAVKLCDLPISTDAALSPDGRTLAVTSNVGNQWQLLVMSLDTLGGGHVLESATGLEFSPAISPDGLWLAHLGQVTGRNEVYLRSFPDGATKVQVSAGGGTAPVWAADGRRLFYLAGDVIVAATLQLGAEVRVLARDTVFTGVAGGDYLGGRPNFDVAADGTRLVVPTLLAQRFELVVEPDWHREFLARVRGAAR
jgi:Tol biopolymer transport system component